MDTRLDKESINSPMEARGFEIGEAYLDRLHLGESPDVASLIKSHPELAPLLEKRLALVEIIFRARVSQDGGPTRLGG